MGRFCALGWVGRATRDGDGEGRVEEGDFEGWKWVICKQSFNEKRCIFVPLNVK